MDKSISTQENDAIGNPVELDESLQPKNRVIEDVGTIHSVFDGMVDDASLLIRNAARITAKINGERPFNTTRLKNDGKAWKSNVSTRFLATSINKIAPRLYIPLRSAKYLTAASMPPGTPNGPEKTRFFRETITDAIRGWRKWPAFSKAIAYEVSRYGFGFVAWPDVYEWRPTFFRMDRAFVPKGTEQMAAPQFFGFKIDYSPSELLDIIKNKEVAEANGWHVDNCKKAVEEAGRISSDTSEENIRQYQDMVRQASKSYSYVNGGRVIQAKHLFVEEASGSISHYILWNNNGDTTDETLLYEMPDRFSSMDDVVSTITFEFGDGTIHGSHGAGQMLFDLSLQIEKTRNDTIDGFRASNRRKLVCQSTADIQKVQISVTDMAEIVANADYATPGSVQHMGVEGAFALDQNLTSLAESIIGAYIPPLPQQGDVKAAQINALLARQQEVNDINLDHWLTHIAFITRAMTIKLLDPQSPDSVAIATRKKLLSKLTPEELAYAVMQPVMKTISDFTGGNDMIVAQFCASKSGNPQYDQNKLEKIQADSIVGSEIRDEIIIDAGDNSLMTEAIRQQIQENTDMSLGKQIPVSMRDNHAVHLQVVGGEIDQDIQGGNMQVAYTKLQHFTQHLQAGISQKSLDGDTINNGKQFIADREKIISEAVQNQAQATQAAAAKKQTGIATPASQAQGGNIVPFPPMGPQGNLS